MADRTYTDAEKLEVLEHFIEQWRPGRSSGIEGERATLLILKSIAKDIRGRLPKAPGRARGRLARAIDKAAASKTGLPGAGYQGRTLFALAEVVLSEWSTIRQALELFEEDVSDG